MTHICVGKLTIIGSDNGLSPGRRQAIIWTNDGILLIRTLENVVCERASIYSRPQWVKSTGAHSLNELQRPDYKIGYQDSSPPMATRRFTSFSSHDSQKPTAVLVTLLYLSTMSLVTAVTRARMSSVNCSGKRDLRGESSFSVFLRCSAMLLIWMRLCHICTIN